DEKLFCLSAICIRHTEWKRCFDEIKSHRVALRQQYGVRLWREIHAHELVSGRGNLGPQTIGKHQRSRIFLGLLTVVAKLPGTMLFNVCLKKAGYKDVQLTAWDRLTNRIERTMRAYEERELPRRGGVLGKMARSLSSLDLDYVNSRLLRYRARAVIIADE